MRMQRLRCMGMALIMLLLTFLPYQTAEAAGEKSLTLQQAQQLAIAGSREYRSIQSKIEMQQVKYVAAVKSIQMKKKNMATFRWTPLLSFKFPEQPALADEYEWQYKPLQISSKIDVLQHQLNDVLYGVREEISLLYIQAYVCQEKISYIEQLRQEKQETLNRNQMRLITGEASQADIDKMTKSVEKLTSDLAAQKRNFENIKQKLSRLIKLDVTAGYRFNDPFVEADIPRSALDSLTTYTLEMDQGFYETKMNTAINRIGLNLNESLMRNQYGSKMNSIQSYVNQAKNGQELDGYSFRKAYNEFLTRIDEPWNGKKKILFIRIPREWFKGEIDGSRYVEDDPYALYTSALDYADAYAEQEKAQSQLETSVRDGYENLITAQNAYQAMVKSNEKLKAELERAEIRNQLGELPYEELSDMQEEYAQYQLEEMDMLAEYSSQLYAFDRLTCGGVSKYLEAGGISMETASGGDSFVQVDEIEGAYYYIQTKIEDNIFLFGISIPDDFTIQITDYELWVNGVQIGERMPSDQEIRHLALDFESVESAQVRLYDGEKLVQVCEIDSQVNRAQLELYGNYRVETDNRRKAASYTYSTNQITGTTEISISPESTEPIVAYRIQDPTGKNIYSEELIPIEESFVYLAAITADLGELVIQFYDEGGTLLYEGYLDTLSGNVYVDE
ncbi:MAG: TolC family protein [Lachnospiraceae bacterium]|nr:TolC family protein [Lachnospiraceae bacterium]